MKYRILIACLIFPMIIFAQIRKDQWLIGGNGFFSYSKSKELKFVSLQLSPAAGYFFADKFAGGLRTGISSDSYRWGSSKYRASTITLAPFLRYYFLPMEQKVNLFTDVSFGYSWGRYKNFRPSSIHKYNYYNIAFMAGPAIFLNEHTALEITVGYNYLSRGPMDSTITHKFQVGVGLQVHLGNK